MQKYWVRIGSSSVALIGLPTTMLLDNDLRRLRKDFDA